MNMRILRQYNQQIKISLAFVMLALLGTLFIWLLNAGEHDREIILTISRNSIGYAELLPDAITISEEIAQLEHVTGAMPIDNFGDVINPEPEGGGRQEKFFQRVGIAENGRLEFREAINIIITSETAKNTEDLIVLINQKVDELSKNGELAIGLQTVYSDDLGQSSRTISRNLILLILGLTILIIPLLFRRSSYLQPVLVRMIKQLQGNFVYFIHGKSSRSVYMFSALLTLCLIAAVFYLKIQHPLGIFWSFIDSNRIIITLDFPSSVALVESENTTKTVERELLLFPKYIQSVIYFGNSNLEISAPGPEGVTMVVELVPIKRDKSAAQIADELNHQLETIAGVSAKARVE